MKMQPEHRIRGDADETGCDKLVLALRDAGYDGWRAIERAIEYVHQAHMNTVFDDVRSETVKMRDRFRAWAA